MYFNNQSDDYEPMAPEELNEMIETWGNELFAGEKLRREWFGAVPTHSQGECCSYQASHPLR